MLMLKSTKRFAGMAPPLSTPERGFEMVSIRSLKPVCKE
jgi:hypothetical protein